MTTKWTPGPWVVRQTVIHGVEYGGHWVEPADENQLVKLTGSGGAESYTRRIVCRQEHDDNEANAHLIASAPELYEALEKAREFIRMFTPREDQLGDEAKDCAIAADAAMKRARGEK